MSTSYARCAKCDQVVPWYGAKAAMGDHVCGKANLKVSMKYHQWFVSYVIHLAVGIAARDGAVAWDETREELDELDLIKDLGKQADVWMQEAFDRGPFTVETSEDNSHAPYYVMHEGIEADDFPLPPMPPPPMYK